ncbi:CBS domain-containing protein [Blastococcus mobilis]|uniref:CBS domain-containing protein n=1 Tax=Blastococcus mobilis TaxID=1938746 RepID=UPI0020CF17A4|nr:CBS domain-containing protein [Blastococcus mobilis]
MAALVRPVRQCTLGEETPGVPPVVLVGSHGEPTALLLSDPRTAEVCTAPVSLRVHPTTDVTEALERALTRTAVLRFDPVVCTDRTGHVLGLLRIEDLASAARKSR